MCVYVMDHVMRVLSVCACYRNCMLVRVSVCAFVCVCAQVCVCVRERESVCVCGNHHPAW